MLKKSRIFKLISGLFLTIAFFLMIYGLVHGGAGISFATFSFWTLIVGINAIATIKERGNYTFPLVLTIGNLAVSITLLVMGQFWWGFTEWLSLIFVLISIVVWFTSTGSLTIVVSTIAITLASIPQLVLAWNEPATISFSVWASLLISSIFSVGAGKNWSIKERLYSVARLIVYALVIIFAVKRFI